MTHQLVTHAVRLLTIGSSDFDVTDDTDAGADAFPSVVDRELKPLLQGLARVRSHLGCALRSYRTAAPLLNVTMSLVYRVVVFDTVRLTVFF
jgi:hypothetical protein